MWQPTGNRAPTHLGLRPVVKKPGLYGKCECGVRWKDGTRCVCVDVCLCVRLQCTLLLCCCGCNDVRYLQGSKQEQHAIYKHHMKTWCFCGSRMIRKSSDVRMNCFRILFCHISQRDIHSMCCRNFTKGFFFFRFHTSSLLWMENCSFVAHCLL